jgi:23S rRNA (uracil1939-C5)-methyltransferase
VLDAAPERLAPHCSHFGACGGCHYQHARYQHQLEAKRAIVVEEFRRIGKIEPAAEIAIVSADPWGYRNRIQLRIDRGRLGYLEPRSHRLHPIAHCPIASPKLNEVIETLSGMIADPRWPHFVHAVEIFTDEQQVQFNVIESDRPVARRFFDWCAEVIPGLVNGALDYEGRFRVSRNSFFQVNRYLIDRLVETALGDISGDTALDLYAGVGLFSLPLAQRFRQVTAVESGSGAARDLVLNAERSGAANLRALHQTAEIFLEELPAAPDFVLLDPPRAGLGKSMVRRLSVLRPPHVTIVACDPATLARDVAGMIAAGYRIEKMTVVDLFPQTFHIETVVEMRAQRLA